MNEHYVGNLVTLSFDVFLDGKAAKISSGRVHVYGPDAKLLVTQSVKDKYTVPGEYNRQVGEYTAIFTVVVEGYGETSHIIKYKIKSLPVGKKIKEQVSYAT